MVKIKKWINNNILKILSIFLLLQPFLDLITSIQLNIFNSNLTIGIVIRFLFIIFGLFYLFFICATPYSKFNIIYIASIVIYFIVFILIIINNKGCNLLLYELTGLFKTFYFPILLLIFFNIFIEKKEVIKTKYLFIVCLIYLVLLLIPLLTKTGFYSYKENIGYIGWFNSANEISVIISILLPFIFMYILKIKNNIYKFIAIILVLLVLFSISTKTPILAFLLISIVLIIKSLTQLVKQKKYKKIIIIFILILSTISISLIVIPKTELYKSIETRLKFFDINLSEVFTDIDALDKVVFSSRLSYLNTTRRNYHNASFIEKIFGIGYIENYGTDNLNLKLIEMDYCDIFYRHGLLGFLLYFSFFVFMVIKIVIFAIKKFTKLGNNIYLLLSLILILFLALFTGHVLTAPAVSILVSVIINSLYLKLFVSK